MIDKNSLCGIYKRALIEKRKLKAINSHDNHYIIHFIFKTNWEDIFTPGKYYPTYLLKDCVKCEMIAEKMRKKE